MVSVFFDMVGLAYWPMRNVTRQPIQHGPDELNQVVPKPNDSADQRLPNGGWDTAVIRTFTLLHNCRTFASIDPACMAMRLQENDPT